MRVHSRIYNAQHTPPRPCQSLRYLKHRQIHAHAAVASKRTHRQTNHSRQIWQSGHHAGNAAGHLIIEQDQYSDTKCDPPQSCAPERPPHADAQVSQRKRTCQQIKQSALPHTTHTLLTNPPTRPTRYSVLPTAPPHPIPFSPLLLHTSASHTTPGPPAPQRDHRVRVHIHAEQCITHCSENSPNTALGKVPSILFSRTSRFLSHVHAHPPHIVWHHARHDTKHSIQHSTLGS
jgi:hypothetical protein